MNPGPISASQSTLSVPPATVTADGTSTATVTVTLKDANGNRIPSEAVTLSKSSGPGTPTITATQGTTDASGIATFTVKSTTAGTDVFAATATTGTVVLTETASVTFTAGPAAQLAFGVQPSTTTSGTAINPAVTVVVQDQRHLVLVLGHEDHPDDHRINNSATLGGTGRVGSVVVQSGGTLSPPRPSRWRPTVPFPFWWSPHSRLRG